MLGKVDIEIVLNQYTKYDVANDCLILDNKGNVYSNMERSIYYDNAEHKFFEYIDFKNSHTKRALVIGINPSMIESQDMDFTNKEIVSYLMNNGYGGYILLNLWSKRTDSSYLLDRYTSSMVGSKDTYNDCSDFISDVLNKSNRTEDILLFWGQSYVKKHGISNTNLTATLNALYPQCFYSAGSKGGFVHPSQKDKNKNSRFKSFRPLVIGAQYW